MPQRVYSDASFHPAGPRSRSEGVAGIAYCGFFGEAGRCVPARSAAHAEVLALLWAMAAARHEVGSVEFCVDFQRGVLAPGPSGAMRAPRALVATILASRPQWSVVHVDRGLNGRANLLARRALGRGLARETS